MSKYTYVYIKTCKYTKAFLINDFLFTYPLLACSLVTVINMDYKCKNTIVMLSKKTHLFKIFIEDL